MRYIYVATPTASNLVSNIMDPFISSTSDPNPKHLQNKHEQVQPDAKIKANWVELCDGGLYTLSEHGHRLAVEMDGEHDERVPDSYISIVSHCLSTYERRGLPWLPPPANCNTGAHFGGVMRSGRQVT